jgi:hypothetical protein
MRLPKTEGGETVMHKYEVDFANIEMRILANILAEQDPDTKKT